MLIPSFCGPFYTQLSPNATIDEAINLYPEKVEQTVGKSPFTLYGAPGTRAFVTLNGGAIRALASSVVQIGFQEYIIAVANDHVYIVDDAANATLLGLTTPGRLPAWIVPYTPNNFFLLCDGLGYIGTISPPSLVPQALPTGFASSATFLDQYIIISDVNTRQFYISAVGDPTTWNPLDVATKEAAPDNLLGVFAANELLWLFGLATTEIWYNSGAAAFPFQRYPGGGVIETGTTAQWSICKVGESIMWVGRDQRGQAVVYKANGLQPERVSNHAVEEQLNDEDNPGLSEIIAYSYQENGHFFYVMNTAVTPNIDITWVYDFTTGMWHKRGLFDGTDYHRQTWMHHTYAFFVSVSVGHYVGGNGSDSDTTGTIYKQGMNIFDYDGEPKRVLRRAPHMTDDLNRTRFDRLRLDLQRTSNPIVTMRQSNDGGQNFGNLHTRTTPSGQSRLIWRQPGSARDKVFEMYSDTACLQAWAGAYVDVNKGTP